MTAEHIDWEKCGLHGNPDDSYLKWLSDEQLGEALSVFDTSSSPGKPPHFWSLQHEQWNRWIEQGIAYIDPKTGAVTLT